MTPTVLIAIFGSVITFLLLILILRGQNSKKDENEEQTFLILQDQLERLRNTIDNKLERSSSELHQVLHRQGTESTRLITEITRELTEVKEGNKQVFSMTEQLSNLEKVLTHQKQRGNLGEASLELILSNILPPGAFKLQYQFKSGEIVDAIIETKEGIIPVDAKFSLDNYNRVTNEDDPVRKIELEKIFKNDLKLRIDETAKYIKEDENTLPFAFATPITSYWTPSTKIFFPIGSTPLKNFAFTSCPIKAIGA